MSGNDLSIAKDMLFLFCFLMSLVVLLNMGRKDRDEEQDGDDEFHKWGEWQEVLTCEGRMMRRQCKSCGAFQYKDCD